MDAALLWLCLLVQRVPVVQLLRLVVCAAAGAFGACQQGVGQCLRYPPVVVQLHKPWEVVRHNFSHEDCQTRVRDSSGREAGGRRTSVTEVACNVPLWSRQRNLIHLQSLRAERLRCSTVDMCAPTHRGQARRSLLAVTACDADGERQSFLTTQHATRLSVPRGTKSTNGLTVIISPQ